MGYPKGRPKKFSYSLITELYRDGKNTMEISRQIGVHHSTVRYALHRRGIDTSYKARMERTITESTGSSRRERYAKKVSRNSAKNGRLMSFRQKMFNPPQARYHGASSVGNPQGAAVGA